MGCLLSAAAESDSCEASFRQAPAAVRSHSSPLGNCCLFPLPGDLNCRRGGPHRRRAGSGRQRPGSLGEHRFSVESLTLKTLLTPGEDTRVGRQRAPWERLRQVFGGHRGRLLTHVPCSGSGHAVGHASPTSLLIPHPIGLSPSWRTQTARDAAPVLAICF